VRETRRPCGDQLDGRIAYDELPDGLVVADDSGQVILVNRRAERLLGLPADELIGKDLPHVLPLVDRCGRDWWELADPYGGLATRTGHPEQSLLLGSREMLVCATFVREQPLGQVHRLVVTLRGGAGRERAERQRADLVATVAHELRTPLAAVKGFTTTLLRRWDRFDDAERRELVAAVRSDADRLGRLVADLLDVGRIEAGRLDLRRSPVDLIELVQRQVAAQVAAGVPAERFRVEQSGPVGVLAVDTDRVEQVLANLLDNAVRHGAGRVTMRLEACPDGVAVTVSDQGDGVPAEQKNLVFQRFWRDGRRGGSGLGLYVARGLVEAHGGTIGVGRAAGGGAAFRFTLPAA
jgi:signal transduction histidine kinase